MSDFGRTLSVWLTFAGCVLIVAVLYWAQAILMPIAFAMLVTFVLAGPVGLLQRWVGRTTAVLAVVALVFTMLGFAGWSLTSQVSQLAGELQGYRANIREKINDVRQAVRGGSVELVQQTIDDIRTEIEKSNNQKGVKPPVVISPTQIAGEWGFAEWVNPVWGPLSTAGLVVVLVIFMLLEREQLRGRLIGLIGHGHLAVTTRAFDEAGERVSRQLLMQTLVNAIYGAGVAIGLSLIGAPYPLLFAVLGAALRYIPYIGPVVAAVLPVIVSLAALPGWTKPLWVAGLFVALELFTNLVLETVLYAGAAGISQVALLIAVAFWTWLWGPMGLLLATPLTSCLVVIGKHVPGLEFLSTLMADAPALSADAAYYQRVLARDQSEASEIIEKHIASAAPETVYDALLLPALNYAERDRLEDRLSAEEQSAVVDTTRELMQDAAVLRREASRTAEEGSADPRPRQAPMRRPRLAVAAFPASGAPDALALEMLAALLEEDSSELVIESAEVLSSEMVERIRAGRYRVVCIADLPPSPPSKTRYVVKRLRAEFPSLHIVVGRWGPAALADDSAALLAEAGANHIGATLIETRDHLRGLIHLALVEEPESATVER
jgi:predicted PurR-regulated permease PerM